MLVKLLSSTQMDKSRDVRRGASRFSRQKNNKQFGVGHKLFLGSDFGGDFVSLEISKKEKLKKLSLVGGANSRNEEGEMGCDVSISDRENEFPPKSQSITSNGTGKRFKLPKRSFDDCNGVDHVSVPRKLRSAMKKRNHGSLSPPLPDSKKLNHTVVGVKSPEKDGVKKHEEDMNLGDLEWSQGQAASGSMSKDEEEVVETLYSLARMFPDNDTNDKSKLSSSSLEANPEARESHTTAVKDSAVAKEDLNSICPSSTAGAAPSSNVQMSPDKTVEVNSSRKPCVQEQPDLPDSKILHVETDSSIPQVNLSISVPSLVTTEQGDQKRFSNHVNFNFNVLCEPILDAGLKQSSQWDTTRVERKPEVSFGATTVESQLAQQDIFMESKKNGLVLWPGLCSTLSQGDGNRGPSRSSAAKIPNLLDTAMRASRPCSLENNPSTIKVSKVTIDGRSMNRCIAHVHISHLIQVLQMSDSKDSSPLPSNQLRTCQGSKQMVPVAVNDLNRVRDGLNCVASSGSIGNSSAERNLYEVKSGIHQRYHQDQSHVALASGLQTSKKQSFDFLSLSAGGGGTEAHDSSIKAGNGLESLSPQFLYLQSLPQHPQLMPFSRSQTRYTSSAYNDHHSAVAAAQQAQLQLPPYFSSPFSAPPLASSLAFTKQKQQLWAAQLSAHYRPAGTSTSLSQFPSWQNGKHDSPTLIPCTQAVITPSPSSLEVFCPMYPPISQQQQQLMAITSSLPPASVKRQDHHLPSIYEETGGGCCPGNAFPLQLLCNERL